MVNLSMKSLSLALLLVHALMAVNFIAASSDGGPNGSTRQPQDAVNGIPNATNAGSHHHEGGTAVTTLLAEQKENHDTNDGNSNEAQIAAKKLPTRVISLAESINRSQKSIMQEDPAARKARSLRAQQQWKTALQEIKDLTVDIPLVSKQSSWSGSTTNAAAKSSRATPAFLTGWKLLLDDSEESKVEIDLETSGNQSIISTSSKFAPPQEENVQIVDTVDEVTHAEVASNVNGTDASVLADTTALPKASLIMSRTMVTSARERLARFEGFSSWERKLQDWKEDVQDYITRVEQENAQGNYSMSMYGIPTSISTSDVEPAAANATSSLASSQTSAIETTPTVTQQEVQVTPPATGDDDVVVAPSVSVPAPVSASASVTTTESSSSTSKREKTILLPAPVPAQPGEPIVPTTDLADQSKNVWIVTTASLPWMTGTAVNPLLRAAYMTRGRAEAGGSITLMLPWLERTQDQVAIYGPDRTFATQADQERHVRGWLKNEAKLERESQELNIEWYNAWQNKAENSIYSMGDITAQIPASAVDIMILEEPEHLNWYRAPGQSWTSKFKHVVGIIHTNYFVYAQEQPAAFIRAPGMRLLCSWMCRAHCHRIIKLSGTLGRFAPEKELVENVHGVRASFLDVGDALRPKLEAAQYDEHPVFAPDADPTVYFIGKMLWTKGLGSLMELLKYAEESAGIQIKIDMYGGGPNKEAAAERAESLGVNFEFHGPIDHSKLGATHKIFINPSTSEVLCTTVAEALAMGKFVVVPSHPSNDFFAQFPNCLTYTNKEEFVGNLYYAMTHAPQPLSEEYAHALSWEAAIERLEFASSIPQKEADAMAEALMSNQTGVEIRLPPLIEDEEDRKRVGTTLVKTRSRYRQFRSRLASELQQNNVLPGPWRQRFVDELDKRLELDIDTLLESPKLRIKLSPAELDKRLLELYNNVAEGPRGDVFRVIGGGSDVALQTLYIKQQARKNGARQRLMTPSFFRRAGQYAGSLSASDTSSMDKPRTPSQWVNLALRRNLLPAAAPSSSDPVDHDDNKPTAASATIATTAAPAPADSTTASAQTPVGTSSQDMTMSLAPTRRTAVSPRQSCTMIKQTSYRSFTPARSPISSYRLLL